MKEKLIRLYKEATADITVPKTVNEDLTSSCDDIIKRKVRTSLFPKTIGDFEKYRPWGHGYIYGRTIRFESKPPIFIGGGTNAYRVYYKRFMGIPKNKKEILAKANSDLMLFKEEHDLDITSSYTDGRKMYNNKDYAYFTVDVRGYVIIHGSLFTQLTKEEYDELHSAYCESVTKYDEYILDKRLEKYK